MEDKENDRRGKRLVVAPKRSSGATATATATSSVSIGGDSLLERLPEGIFTEIISMLEPETLTSLCSLACVSRTLQSYVNKALSSFSSVDLSEFSLDSQTFDGIIRRFGKIKKITLNCLRLSDSSIRRFLGPDVEELIMLKCSSLSYKLLSSIGKFCPNLRGFHFTRCWCPGLKKLDAFCPKNPGAYIKFTVPVYVHPDVVFLLLLTLEFREITHKYAFFNLSLQGCQHLESLKIKVREGHISDFGFILRGIYQELPQTMKVLKLQRVRAFDIIRTITHPYLVAPMTCGQTLTRISLAIDIISDTLISAIAHNLPLLVELDLKDRQLYEPSDDLSDLGIQSLVNCKHLKSLSLMRSRQNVTSSFKRTTDMGMFLLSECCKLLESVRFGGFSKVSDAGFTSILNSCLNLKKFEIHYGSLLTDLTFQDFSEVPRALVEVKLVSCASITSDAVCELATCSSLGVLDLFGCKSVADSCLNNISRLTLLTSLNLSGVDVTDVGMVVLGNGYAPISCLSLRGCRRVSDEGIISLLRNEGKIRKTLLSLDLGYMPELTDNAITTIADACVRLKELSIRYCLSVTDASVNALALTGSVRRLDLYTCSALSVESFHFLKKPFFRGLQWIGINRTRLVSVGDSAFDEICRERQWLTICKDGCEVGCHDGWQFHRF